LGYERRVQDRVHRWQDLTTRCISVLALASVELGQDSFQDVHRNKTQTIDLFSHSKNLPPMKQKPTPQISNLLNPILPTTLRHSPISLLITLNIHIMDRLPRIMNHFALLDLRLASPLPLNSRLLGSGNMSLR